MSQYTLESISVSLQYKVKTRTKKQLEEISANHNKMVQRCRKLFNGICLNNWHTHRYFFFFFSNPKHLVSIREVIRESGFTLKKGKKSCYFQDILVFHVFCWKTELQLGLICFNQQDRKLQICKNRQKKKIKDWCSFLFFLFLDVSKIMTHLSSNALKLKGKLLLFGCFCKRRKTDWKKNLREKLI